MATQQSIPNRNFLYSFFLLPFWNVQKAKKSNKTKKIAVSAFRFKKNSNIYLRLQTKNVSLRLNELIYIRVVFLCVRGCVSIFHCPPPKMYFLLFCISLPSSPAVTHALSCQIRPSINQRDDEHCRGKAQHPVVMVTKDGFTIQPYMG